MGASPTRPPLQPEATEAVMVVTKWLKPSDSVSQIGEPRLPLWVKTPRTPRVPAASGPGGIPEGIRAIPDIADGKSEVEDKASVPRTWPVNYDSHAGRLGINPGAPCDRDRRQPTFQPPDTVADGIESKEVMQSQSNAAESMICYPYIAPTD